MHNQTSPGRVESVSLRHENFVNRNSQRQVHYHTLARFVQVLPPMVQAQNWTALKSAAGGGTVSTTKSKPTA